VHRPENEIRNSQEDHARIREKRSFPDRPEISVPTNRDTGIARRQLAGKTSDPLIRALSGCPPERARIDQVRRFPNSTVTRERTGGRAPQMWPFFATFPWNFCCCFGPAVHLPLMRRPCFVGHSLVESPHVRTRAAVLVSVEHLKILPAQNGWHQTDARHAC
jgi:hypothetical protein